MEAGDGTPALDETGVMGATVAMAGTGAMDATAVTDATAITDETGVVEARVGMDGTGPRCNTWTQPDGKRAGDGRAAWAERAGPRRGRTSSQCARDGRPAVRPQVGVLTFRQADRLELSSRIFEFFTPTKGKVRSI